MTRLATLMTAALAVTVFGGAAAARSPSTDPLVFSMLVDTQRLEGEFTPIGDIPGGSFRITESVLDPDTGRVSATYVLDPAPVGGDTITIETVGQRVGELPESHAVYGRTDWSVTEAGSEYQPLVGSHGLAFPIQDVSWRVVTLVALDDAPTT